MRRFFIRLIIVTAIVLELGFVFFAPKHSYRPTRPETIQARTDYLANPNDTTKAAFLDKLDRELLSSRRQHHIFIGSMLLADIIGIYLFWNYGVKKSAA